MKRLIAAVMLSGIGLFTMAPAANALLVNVPVLDVEVKVLEPSAPLVDVTANADVQVLPVLTDPLVHVCVNGVVQSVLLSAALNAHLDVLGSDADCKPLVAVPTTTPANPSDPLVHVCVDGVVNSVLASVAANLHLDVLGSDAACKPSTTPTTSPPGTDDPLVHVCVDGKVQSLLLSAALNLHLDVLGTDQKCPAPTTPTTGKPSTGVTTTTTTAPDNTTVTTAPGNTETDVKVEPSAKKHTGPLAFTGGFWGILAILGAGLGITGLLLLLLGELAKRRA